jgi:hypothetical protein
MRSMQCNPAKAMKAPDYWKSQVLQYIRREFNEAISLYGEGLGGYVAFYLPWHMHRSTA